jgi:hypothetical protein
MMKRSLMLFAFLLALSVSAANKEVYFFTSFNEPATDGLRLLYSYDGYKWEDLGSIFLKPKIGEQPVMRDPSITKGPDGTYHFVWTSSWKGNLGFGYASSKDLIHWSEQRYLPVMAYDTTTCNVWAPEVFYDAPAKQFILVWASTVPYKFEKGIEDEFNNHRLYFVTTPDFKSFSKTKLFYDPGFSSIDAAIVYRGKEDYVLVFKDNTRNERDIKVAFSKSPLGPWSKASAACTSMYTEGPSVAKVGSDWLIYFDAYRDKRYSAVKTSDFIHFTDANPEISVPQGHKHGTVFMSDEKALLKLKKEVAQRAKLKN